MNGAKGLALEFENGERRIFDMGPYLERKPFNRLKEGSVFESARVHLGTVEWAGHVDIAPETLYARSVPDETFEKPLGVY